MPEAGYNSVNKLSMKQLCKDFLERYGLSSNIDIEQEEDAIYWLEKTSLLIAQSSTSNDKLLLDPSWGIIQVMLDSAYQHIAGSLILFVMKLKSSCEALSRVAFESSVNVLYVLNDSNRMERILHHFSSYVAGERKQNQNWAESIANLNAQDQILQKRGIEQKSEYLDMVENFLSGVANELGLLYPPQKLPKNTYDKFEKLGRKTAYRTLYAAMSSQIHNDAEDLLASFLLSAFNYIDEEQRLEFRRKLTKETENFSRLMLYSSLQYYLEACLKYCEVFELDDVVHDVAKGYRAILEFTAKMAVNNNPHLFE